jgi:hypothetical protein
MYYLIFIGIILFFVLLISFEGKKIEISFSKNKTNEEKYKDRIISYIIDNQKDIKYNHTKSDTILAVTYEERNYFSLKDIDIFYICKTKGSETIERKIVVSSEKIDLDVKLNSKKLNKILYKIKEKHLFDKKESEFIEKMKIFDNLDIKNSRKRKIKNLKK